MPNTAEFWRGFRDSLPIGLAAGTFGLVYGAVASEKGLSFLEGTLLTAGVFAGASQFMALQFWSDPLPFATIVLIVLAVNFRHVLYGASLSRKLTQFTPFQKFAAFFFMADPVFALSEKRHEDGQGNAADPGLTPSYWFGLAVALYPVWVGASMVGLAFGNFIENPEAFGLDFVLPIYFMVLLLGFRKRANWLVVVLVAAGAGFAALQTLGSPWHITIGSLAGILMGAFLGVAPDADDA
ncbi:MAG: AzlC family ABC transporter permease [Pseudomonadota bacterium]